MQVICIWFKTTFASGPEEIQKNLILCGFLSRVQKYLICVEAQDSPNALETSPGQVHPPSYRKTKTESHIYMIKDYFYTKHASSMVGLLLFISTERSLLLNTRVSQIWCVHSGRVQRQRTQWPHSAEDNPRRSSYEWCTQNLHTRKYLCKWCNVNWNTIWHFVNNWLMMSPGPMPTLMMSAPARISSSTISPVTTLPAYKTQMDFKILRWLLMR